MNDGSKPLIEPLEAIIHSEVTLYLRRARDCLPSAKELLVASDMKNLITLDRRWHVAPAEESARLQLAFDRYGTPPYNLKLRKFSLWFFHYPTDSGVLGLRLVPTDGPKDSNDRYLILIHPTTMSLPNEEVRVDCAVVSMADYYARRRYLGYSRGFEEPSVDFPLRIA